MRSLITLFVILIPLYNLSGQDAYNELYKKCNIKSVKVYYIHYEGDIPQNRQLLENKVYDRQGYPLKLDNKNNTAEAKTESEIQHFDECKFDECERDFGSEWNVEYPLTFFKNFDLCVHNCSTLDTTFFKKSNIEFRKVTMTVGDITACQIQRMDGSLIQTEYYRYREDGNLDASQIGNFDDKQKLTELNFVSFSTFCLGPPQKLEGKIKFSYHKNGLLKSVDYQLTSDVKSSFNKSIRFRDEFEYESY